MLLRGTQMRNAQCPFCGCLLLYAIVLTACERSAPQGAAPTVVPAAADRVFIVDQDGRRIPVTAGAAAGYVPDAECAVCHDSIAQTFAHHGKADPIETAIRAWAALDEEVAAAVTRIDKRRIDFVVELAIATGMKPALARRRTRLFYRSLIGEFFWRQTTGTPAPHAATAAAGY